MDIKLILGYSTSTVELSHGDTRAGETRKSRGWVVSFQDAVGGQRMPVTRPSLRARLQNWRQRFLSREVCYHYHIRNFTTGTRQTGDVEKNLDSGGISWNFISNIWLILIYFLRQSHWCHVFPHNAVFCASWETMIQHFLKQNATIASGNFFQVVPNTHSVRFDDGSVFILWEGDFILWEWKVLSQWVELTFLSKLFWNGCCGNVEGLWSFSLATRNNNQIHPQLL